MILDLFRKEIEFNKIQEYHDIKDVVRRALAVDDNYNLLFVGPPASAKTIPNLASRAMATVGASGTQYNVPGSILRIVPIKSFDMTIYDSHGKVIWNIANQKPSPGLKLVHVVFPKGTSGLITISIHSIKSPRPNVPTTIGNYRLCVRVSHFLQILPPSFLQFLNQPLTGGLVLH